MTGFNKRTAHTKLGKMKQEIKEGKEEMGTVWLLLTLLSSGICAIGILVCLFSLISDWIARIAQMRYSPGFGEWELFLHLFGFGVLTVGLLCIGCINVLRKEKKR